MFVELLRSVSPFHQRGVLHQGSISEMFLYKSDEAEENRKKAFQSPTIHVIIVIIPVEKGSKVYISRSV